MMKIVYVAGPFRASTPWGIEKNIRLAEELALGVWKLGAACICPHANTRFFQYECPDDIWLKGDLEIVKRCDAVLMTPTWESSVGARAERELAVELGIPVFYGIDDLQEWLEPRLASV
jgi:hypothetical protein